MTLRPAPWRNHFEKSIHENTFGGARPAPIGQALKKAGLQCHSTKTVGIIEKEKGGPSQTALAGRQLSFE